MHEVEHSRILHLEDDPLDRELVQRTLAAEGLAAEIVCAATQEEFTHALAAGGFDLILSDFTLPGYGGTEALAFSREKCPEVPFIFVSGTIGEERAIECLKNGATDYVLKRDPHRLVPAIKRALRDAAEHARQREAELALRQSEKRYRLLFERNPQPMWIYDSATLRFLAVNDAAIAHYGWTREEFLAMTIREVRPPEDVPALETELQSLPPGFSVGATWRHRKKDGTIIAVDIAAHNLPFGDRDARLVTINDITERLTAEAERQQSDERFAKIFHSSPLAIGYGTTDGRILDANRQLCELFGCSRDELIGHTVAELNLWARPEERAQALAKLQREKALRNFEAKFRRKSGEIRTGLLSIEMLQLGTVPALLAMVVDITDRKALEGELLRANRVQSVGRLASGIAHDMNNILAPIMMAAPLLRMKFSPEESEKMLANIELSAKRGADLVKQLLMFGRGVEGERGPVHLVNLVADVLKVAAQTFPKNIVVRSALVAETWTVRGDVSQLHQVVLNLVVNARDAMPNGGTLTVGAKNVRLDENFVLAHPEMKPGPYVCLSIADTGTGIPPEIVDKIFDPFFTTKTVGHGTGLGLSTVLGIVRSHNGLVTVHSEENIGTTFTVYLPAIFATSEAVASPATGAPPRGSNELILVVDDEETIRTTVRHALTQQNYRVLVASDGAEAAAMFARNLGEIKLVVTDLDMPFMDGLSLARTLQRMKPEIKILVSSGIGSAKNAQRCGAEIAALGLPPILPKPYTNELLFATVHELLAENGPRPTTGGADLNP